MTALSRLLLGCLLGAVAASAADRMPNVLFIISDDQGWADYGFMGHPHLRTPHLDRLAAQSLTFERGYSTAPLCRPSLASIVTGLHPHQHGVTGNDPALPDKGVNAMAARGNPKYARYYDTITAHFRQQPNFVRDLVSRGYLALQTGKWWEGDPVKTAGFTHAMTRGEIKGSRHGDAGLDIGRQGLDPVYRFIAAAGDTPWLVWYAPMLPHAPHTPPADLLQLYLDAAPSAPVAHYWACVTWFDRTCGELLDHLERHALRTNTIVLYTTDNGWLQDPTRTNRFAPRSKLSPYEGGVRTPIMVSWPGRVQPRLEKQHPASNIDLWPTLAALLQTPLPRDLPGINLTDPRAVTGRSSVFGEQYTHDIADVDTPTLSLEHRWLVAGWWKLVVPHPLALPDAKPQLYNLAADPWEQSDLAPREPRRVSQLRQQLDAWWPPPANPPPKPRAAATPATAHAAAADADAEAETVTYKHAGARDLRLFIEKPADWKPADRRPAVVFFFGGGWVGGSPAQFLKQSQYLATRGMVGFRAEYRVIPRGDAGPPTLACADAKSAMRYVRAHAAELGVDSQRIAAAGGSAGGHLAAFTALVPGLDDPQDDLGVSCKPNALLLFNPVFNNGPGHWGHARVGDRYRDFSPAHHVASNAPPTVVFLGDQDRLIPVPALRDFEAQMTRAGARCDAHVYPGAGHGFFNRDTPRGAWFTRTLFDADKFLLSLGWLQGEPTLTPPSATPDGVGARQ
ncbi:MAG: sulfatase-like hydrolase/transferase [Verrucomicrobia bacterium]|nr:sulfatase-like hydrolase/transferase [Verrucomicrobiota bacterium]